MQEAEIREQIVSVARRMYHLGLINMFEGNISVRYGDTMLITPSQQDKETLSPEQIVQLDFDGTAIGETQYRASSEWKMHRALYRLRADVMAVVHNHSPFASAHAIAGKPILAQDIPEVGLLLGQVPVCRYGRPSTDAIFEEFPKYFCEEKCDAVLLANHGVVSVGQSLLSAFSKAEEVEKIAKVRFLVNQLGGASSLPEGENECLEAYRRAQWDKRVFRDGKGE